MKKKDTIIKILSITIFWLHFVQSQELETETVTESESILVDVDNLEENVNNTKFYDVIINDRTKNDIIVTDDEIIVTDDDENQSSKNKSSVSDVKKLLAAQAHAIEVLNMIEHLEVEMKDMIAEKANENIETTTTEIPETIESVEITTFRNNIKDMVEDNDNDVANEIKILQAKVKQLQARGQKVRDAIIEQTKLLLSEESLLSEMRTRMVLRQLQRQKQRQKTTQTKLKQQNILKDLESLENLLKDLRNSEVDDVNNLKNSRKKLRKKLNLSSEKDKSDSDSILSHPSITGLDDPFADDFVEYEEIPTIVVDDEHKVDPVIINEYEIELDPVPQEQVFVVPVEPSPPTHLHGHFLKPKNPHRQYQYRNYDQYYHNQKTYRNYPHYPPLAQQPHYLQSQPEPEYYHPPPQEPAYFQEPIIREPHVTLTGSLLRGFEHLGRNFN